MKRELDYYEYADDTEEEDNNDTEDELESVNAKRLRYFENFKYNSNNISNSKSTTETKPTQITKSPSNLYVKKSDSTIIIDLDADDDDTEPETEEKPNKFSQKKQSSTTTTTTSTSTTTTTNTKVDETFEFDFGEDFEGSNFKDEDDAVLQSVLRRSKVETNKYNMNSDSPINNKENKNKTNTTSSSTTTTTTTNSSPVNKDSTSGSSAVNNSGEIFYLNQLPTNQSNNFINIFNIFGKPNMRSALISGFSLDWKWIRSQISLCQGGRDVPITFIRNYTKEEKPGKFQTKDAGENIIFVHPPMNNGGFGCQHSKLMLLMYDSYVRVVIPSANPTKFDYDDIGQTIWFQDFPKKTPHPPSDFQENLKYFIKSSGLPNNFLDSYDFSIATVHLIISVPGYFKGANLNQCGHMQLRRYLKSYYGEKEKQLKPKDDTDLELHVKNRQIHYQTSSIGLVNDKWNPQFFESTQVLSKTKLKDPTSSSLRIIFPSFTYVTSKKSRVRCSSVLFMTTANYENETFPKKSLCHLKPIHKHRENLILHSKMLVGTTKFEEDDRLRFDWIYVGSHNFSPAAWGRLQKDNTQLYISNFEIGVLVLNNKKYNDLSPPKWHQNIPFEIPAPPYKESDQPFIQEKFQYDDE